MVTAYVPLNPRTLAIRNGNQNIPSHCGRVLSVSMVDNEIRMANKPTAGLTAPALTKVCAKFAKL